MSACRRAPKWEHSLPQLWNRASGRLESDIVLIVYFHGAAWCAQVLASLRGKRKAAKDGLLECEPAARAAVNVLPGQLPVVLLSSFPAASKDDTVSALISSCCHHFNFAVSCSGTTQLLCF